MSIFERQMDEILDAYLNGTISEAEVKAMHEQLQRGEMLTCIDSQTEVQQIELPSDLLRPTPPPTDEPPNNFNTYLQEDYARHQIQSVSRFNQWFSYIFVGILMVTLALFIPFWQIFMPFKDTQALFTTYFEALPLTDDAIKSTPETSILWTSAQINYHQQKYDLAVKDLKQLSPIKDADILHLYTGIAYLAQEQQQALSAIEHLQKAQHIDHDLAKNATWYLALAYMQEGNISMAQDVLKSIVDNLDMPNRDKANALLVALNK